MPSGQDIADLLSGAAGAPVNRPALNAFVAQSQARNGLVSAQTQDAMIKAQQAQESAAAYARMPDELVAANPSMAPSEASLMRDLLIHIAGGDPVNAAKFVGQMKLMYGSPEQQTQGQQGFEGKVAPPVAAPPNFIMPPGSGLAGQPIQQSPLGAQQLAQSKALTGLDVARAEEEHAKAKALTNPVSSLDPNTVDMAADVAMADPAKMNSFAGFGQSGQNNKNAINNRIAQKLSDAGMTPADMIRQRAIAHASIGGATQAAKQIQTLDAFTPLVKANGDRVLQLLDQIGADGGNFPVVAGLERSLGRQLGDSDLAELHSVFGTYQNEVARLLAAGPSMNGVISDKARGDIQAMAPENMTAAQARQVINRINTELSIRRNSAQSALESAAQSQLPVTELPAPGAAPTPAAAGAPTPQAPIPLDQYLKQKGF